MQDGELIKMLRKILKIKQADFAKRISTTQGHISEIEHGKKRMSDRTIKIISSEFNVNEIWLKTGEGEVFTSSPYEKEFIEIFQTLTPVTQKHLIEVARGLVKVQSQLLNYNNFS